MRYYTNVFKMVGFGNYRIRVAMNCQEKNKNTLTIFDGNMGETYFESEEIWDSDIPKIVRILSEHEYGHMKIQDICHKLNKGCRHLNIYNY